MGARGPEVVAANHELPTSLSERIEAFATRGGRVLLVARSPKPLIGEVLPEVLEPVGLVVLEEQIRPEAGTTIDYLLAQGVHVKVLSGDDPRTVASISERVGIPGSAKSVDARELPDDQTRLASVVEATSIFGRVQPDQKRAIVAALQSAATSSP